MVVKNIKEMGFIIFDNFFNSKNIKIDNLNDTPIKDSEKIGLINNCELKKLLNNSYIYSLLHKRKIYIVYECNPARLLSKYRYDIYIKLFYVKSFVENTNYEFAKDIYLSSIKAFNNFKEPDGTKKCKDDFLKKFNDLIINIQENGFQKSIIPISKTGIPIDGAHRLSICLYFKIKIKFVVFDILDGKYDKYFFEKRGMDKKYIDYIDKIVEKY